MFSFSLSLPNEPKDKNKLENYIFGNDMKNSLDRAAFAVLSVENFEFSVDGRANGGRLLLGQEVSLRFPMGNFDPRSVNKERVV